MERIQMNRWEPVGASTTALLGVGLDVTQMNGWLQCAVGALTLAWWIRIWLTNPNCPPPPPPSAK